MPCKMSKGQFEVVKGEVSPGKTFKANYKQHQLEEVDQQVEEVEEV